jgi:ABC-2 type transport system permease protein
MSPTLLIARRELHAYLRSWTGYIIIAILLAVGGLLFNSWVLGGVDKRSSEVVTLFFFGASGFVAVASVFFTMRLIAEERQTGTVNLLYSAPITDAQIILGKYVSALAFLAIFLLLTSYMPMLVLVNGKVSFGHLVAGYFGLMLIGSACIAIGTFGSALARSQIVSAVITAAMLVAMLTCWYLAKVTDRPLNDLFSALALHGIHFRPFSEGIVHVRDVVYYVAVTYFALFGATRVLEARRWR